MMNFEQKVKQESTLLFRLAYKFFAYKLGITDEELNLITINMVKRLRGASGNCRGIYTLDGSLRAIEISIMSYASDLGIIDVMAHEMVHAAQNLRGEFSFIERKVPIFKWLPQFTKTMSYKVHSGQILEETPYYDMICEQEAFSKSRELSRQFLNFVNILENHINYTLTESINI